MLPFFRHKSQSVEISELKEQTALRSLFIFFFLQRMHTVKGSRQICRHMCHVRLVWSPDSGMESCRCGVWACLWTRRSLNPKITFAYLWRWVMPAHAPLGQCLLPSQAETVIYCLLPALLLSSPLSSLPFLLLLFYLAPIPPSAPTPRSLWIIRTHAGIFAAAYPKYQLYSAWRPRCTALFASIFSGAS